MKLNVLAVLQSVLQWAIVIGFSRDVWIEIQVSFSKGSVIRIRTCWTILFTVLSCLIVLSFLPILSFLAILSCLAVLSCLTVSSCVTVLSHLTFFLSYVQLFILPVLIRACFKRWRWPGMMPLSISPSTQWRWYRFQYQLQFQLQYLISMSTSISISEVSE